MNRSFFFSLIFVLFHVAVQAQSWKRVGAWGNRLTGIDWVTEQIGFVSGDQIILKTIDGGLSWTEQLAPVKTHMHGLDFFNENIGLMVGENGQVFRTTNGGETWSLIKLPTDKTLRSVQFLNQTRVYIVGESGEVYRSTNSGSSWAKQSVGSTVNLNGMHFANADTGYVAAADGRILRTFNSGNNWAFVNTGQSNGLNDVYFTNAKNGYAIGQLGTILRSTDAGQTWTQVTSGTERNLNTVAFNRTNPLLGVVLGDTGTSLRTINGGTTFDGINIPTTQTSLSVDFRFTSNIVFAVGTNGVIASSTNSGGSWTVRLSGFAKDYTATQFRTGVIGYIIGEDGLVLSTGNGGITLTDRTRPLSATFRDIAFTTNAFGYISGDEGTILRTSNSGANWTSLNPGTTDPILGLFFFNNTNGFAVGNNGFMARTVDSGVSWQKISVNNTTRLLRDVHFFDLNEGFVFGESGFIAWSNDGGLTWQNAVKPIAQNLRGFSVLDTQTALVVGDNGTVLKSTDRGKSWSAINIGETTNLRSAHFLDESIGFLAGENGLMMNSRDGGQTWQKMPTGTFQHINRISFGDLSSGYAVGDNGTLLNYSCQVPDTPTLIFGESNVCLGQFEYQIQEPMVADIAYEWRVDGGTILSGQGTTKIQVRWDTPGRNAVLVRGTNNCGNGGTQGLEVVVSTLPQSISQVEGDGVVCINGSMDYSVNSVPGTIYVWEVTGGTILQGQGTASVRVQWNVLASQNLSVTPSNPCGQGQKFSRTISVISPPEKPSDISGPDRVALTEETYTVTAVAGVNFQWSVSGGGGRIISGQGTNSVKIRWEREGDFKVTVVPTNSCNAGPSSTFDVNVNIITSLGKEINPSRIKLYPNPSNGETWVDFEGIVGVRSIRAVDMLGKERLLVLPEEGQTKIRIDGLTQGMYIISVSSREQEYSMKLVVK